MKKRRYEDLTPDELIRHQLKQKGWAVVNQLGYIDLHTVSGTRSDSIRRFEADSTHSWKDWYRHGWRCVKVEVITNP
ncbi:hypothetical protein SAMN04487996_10415 [Dyadobacter soli]|uniref:Uncharacterized protein n=1 Tax=Dyadobacter soli TaxID=659014 RepID=A0A1G7AYT3_9BACT|nr:hypothetical protein [Dyadobacter soli]SDE19921.1 hypothetical protein SAMN04487996_10415 [Dyadobacter soli]